jgi:hypothetical protein
MLDEMLYQQHACHPPGENPHLSGVDDASTCQPHALTMQQKSQNASQPFQLSDVFVSEHQFLSCQNQFSYPDCVVSHEIWRWHEN